MFDFSPDQSLVITRDLLSKYAARPPRLFIQLDHFGEEGDGIAALGAFSFAPTVELMHGSSVRVLVDPSITLDQFAAMLHQMAGDLTPDLWRHAQDDAAQFHARTATPTAPVSESWEEWVDRIAPTPDDDPPF